MGSKVGLRTLLVRRTPYGRALVVLNEHKYVALYYTDSRFMIAYKGR
jgi:hypothetical protein